jgi:hypothetical protein
MTAADTMPTFQPADPKNAQQARTSHPRSEHPRPCVPWCAWDGNCPGDCLSAEYTVPGTGTYWVAGKFQGNDTPLPDELVIELSRADRLDDPADEHRIMLSNRPVAEPDDGHPIWLTIAAARQLRDNLTELIDLAEATPLDTPGGQQ